MSLPSNYLNWRAWIWPRITIFLVIVVCFETFAETNSWTKLTSGYWEEQSYWSLGILPESSQPVVLNTPGWKALTIGAGTVQNFPQSMQIQELRIESPTDSHNVLVMNFSGFARPLQAGSLIVGSNSAVVMQSAALEVIATTTNGTTGNMLVGGTFSQGDYSQVHIEGRLDIGRGTHGAYFLTNGTLSVGSEFMGYFGNSGTLVQYGGSHLAGTITINTDGELNLYGGQLRATNGIEVGFGDYANHSGFSQYGGDVVADTIINGRYQLYGGTITGKMEVVMPAYQRVDGAVMQAGGTNFASSLDIGQPNRFGGRGFYTLSNGVLHVDSSLTFRGGWFVQYDGVTSIGSNLLMLGTDVGLGIASADYTLNGGMLSAGGLMQKGARFQQDGGTNSITGDLILWGAPPVMYGPPQTAAYTLASGALSASNIIVNASFYGGFRQTGGLCQIAAKLTLQDVLPGAYYFTLEGGTLAVKDIEVLSCAFFQHTAGTIIHSGLLGLDQGSWRGGPGDLALGRLQLLGNTNSSIVFPGSSSMLHFGDSSSQTWSAGSALIVSNWNGSVAGGGATRLYFGIDASGLSPAQLDQVQFALGQDLYSAKMLSTGEIVPNHAISASVAVFKNDNDLVLTWQSGWSLQTSTNASGHFEDVSDATSPHIIESIGRPQQFFRLTQ